MNWKKTIIGTWSWKRPFYSLGSIYLLFLLITLFAADWMIFKPPGGDFKTPNQSFLTLKSSDGEDISAYYREPDGGMPILLWSHGNAEDLRTVHSFMDDFHSLGFGTMAYDYPGYGLSSGKPREKGCYAAIQAAYDHLTKELKHPPSRIILVGQSVGSGPTCWLASQEEAAGVILLSPFISAFRSVTRIPLFPRDRFLNHKRIKKMKQPLLIIHGTEDRIIGHWNGQKLHDLSPASSKRLLSIEGAGHNDLFHVGAEKLIFAIEEFANEVYPR